MQTCCPHAGPGRAPSSAFSQQKPLSVAWAAASLPVLVTPRVPMCPVLKARSTPTRGRGGRSVHLPALIPQAPSRLRPSWRKGPSEHTCYGDHHCHIPGGHRAPGPPKWPLHSLPPAPNLCAPPGQLACPLLPPGSLPGCARISSSVSLPTLAPGAPGGRAATGSRSAPPQPSPEEWGYPPMEGAPGQPGAVCGHVGLSRRHPPCGQCYPGPWRRQADMTLGQHSAPRVSGGRQPAETPSLPAVSQALPYWGQELPALSFVFSM